MDANDGFADFEFAAVSEGELLEEFLNFEDNYQGFGDASGMGDPAQDFSAIAVSDDSTQGVTNVGSSAGTDLLDFVGTPHFEDAFFAGTSTDNFNASYSNDDDKSLEELFNPSGTSDDDKALDELFALPDLSFDNGDSQEHAISPGIDLGDSATAINNDNTQQIVADPVTTTDIFENGACTTSSETATDLPPAPISLTVESSDTANGHVGSSELAPAHASISGGHANGYVNHPELAFDHDSISGSHTNGDIDYPGDVTTESRWVEESHNEFNLPYELALLEYGGFKYSQFKNRKPYPLTDNYGHRILDHSGNRELPDFAPLPRHVSSKVEGWRLVFYRHCDPRITLDDVIDRMHFPATDHEGAGPLHMGRTLFKQELQARIDEFCKHHAVLEPLDCKSTEYSLRQEDLDVVKHLSVQQLKLGIAWDTDGEWMWQPQPPNFVGDWTPVKYGIPAQYFELSVRLQFIVDHRERWGLRTLEEAKNQFYLEAGATISGYVSANEGPSEFHESMQNAFGSEVAPQPDPQSAPQFALQAIPQSTLQAVPQDDLQSGSLNARQVAAQSAPQGSLQAGLQNAFPAAPQSGRLNALQVARQDPVRMAQVPPADNTVRPRRGRAPRQPRQPRQPAQPREPAQPRQRAGGRRPSQASQPSETPELPMSPAKDVDAALLKKFGIDLLSPRTFGAFLDPKALPGIMARETERLKKQEQDIAKELAKNPEKQREMDFIKTLTPSRKTSRAQKPSPAQMISPVLTASPPQMPSMAQMPTVQTPTPAQNMSGAQMATPRQVPAMMRMPVMPQMPAMPQVPDVQPMLDLQQILDHAEAGPLSDDWDTHLDASFGNILDQTSTPAQMQSLAQMVDMPQMSFHAQQWGQGMGDFMGHMQAASQMQTPDQMQFSGQKKTRYQSPYQLQTPFQSPYQMPAQPNMSAQGLGPVSEMVPQGISEAQKKEYEQELAALKRKYAQKAMPQLSQMPQQPRAAPQTPKKRAAAPATTSPYSETTRGGAVFMPQNSFSQDRPPTKRARMSPKKRANVPKPIITNRPVPKTINSITSPMSPLFTPNGTAKPANPLLSRATQNRTVSQPVNTAIPSQVSSNMLGAQFVHQDIKTQLAMMHNTLNGFGQWGSGFGAEQQAAALNTRFEIDGMIEIERQEEMRRMQGGGA